VTKQFILCSGCFKQDSRDASSKQNVAKTFSRAQIHGELVNEFAMPKNVNSPRKRLTRQELRDLDLEILFLEGIARRDPAFVEALKILGDNYTRRGRYEEGLRIDERLAQLCPDDSVVHYNLACSYSLTRQLEWAIEALESAINLGYRNFKHMSQDPDLKNLREHAGYERIRAKVRRMKVKQVKTD
jgi:Flp pilus assembly protein TadD